MTPDTTTIPSGIAPLDDRLGGLDFGGNYLVVGAPGPEKMVAALQFVHAGITDDEPSVLVTNSDVETLLGVAEAWGMDLRDAWLDGLLQVVGFKDDFELRAIRSIAPEEGVEELESLIGDDAERIAVDPGSMFLTGGAKTLLGSAYLAWARSHPATVLTTFSVDGGATSLPSSADWLVHATTGRLLLEKRADGLYQVTVSKAIPRPGERDETISLELKPGEGLVEPEHFRSRRGADRGGIDEGRLLLVSLGDSHASDLETWATRAFQTDVVSEPFEAVAKVQAKTRYGAILIHAPRMKVRDAIQACMAIRPLSRAAIVFASDDAVRATDRIQILEAGADDCLSGGLDFRELGLRIKQSMATGAKPVLVDASGDRKSATAGLTPDESDGGRVPRSVFIQEVQRRAANPDLAFFCVLDVTAGALSSDELEEALADQVRADEGDIVSGDTDRCAVLLQGAREKQLGAFLGRLKSTLEARGGGNGGSVSIDVLSHPAQSNEIMALLGASGATRE
ncbi:MAG: ATPase domain-containing protein [Longimicrobiales bacterium]|nr:ATPase domain-containing protein [Longimicrobiales bacterium]